MKKIDFGRPGDEEGVDKDISQVDDDEFEPEEEEEYEVETVPKNDNDWGGEDIDANNGSDGDGDGDGDADLECLIDVDTDVKDDIKEDIEVWYAKAKLFLDHVHKFSRAVCEHLMLNLSLDETMKLFKGCSSITVHI